MERGNLVCICIPTSWFSGLRAAFMAFCTAVDTVIGEQAVGVWLELLVRRAAVWVCVGAGRIVCCAVQ